MTSHRVQRPSRRTTRLSGLVAVVVGLLLSGLLIWTTSYAAYSATTQNSADSWTTGTVFLRDDDGGAALFTAEKLRPGSTGSRCLVVTSDGSLPGTVKLYAKDLTGPALLTQNIHVDVAQGSGGTAADCTGFVADAAAPVFSSTLATLPTGYGTGGAAWTLTGTPGEQRTYRITYRVDPNTPNDTQATRASTTFVWEAQTPAS